MASQEINPTSGLRMETVGRGADLARRPRFRCAATTMLAVRPDDPGPLSGDAASGPLKDPRQSRKRDRRPAPPSLRLPPASMGRASFLRLVAAWLAAVAAVLALALAVRLFG